MRNIHNILEKKQLIAFVHIEKAAGTTFTSILQQNFLFRHCNVKPLKKNDKGVFSSDSMKIVYLINPLVRSISGHSVMPYSDLEKLVSNIKYITILREPYARYISHYQYQVDRMGRNFMFQDFLNAEFTHNFQTLKIAGCPDVRKAKKILDNFFLVGVSEEFDLFIKILQNKFLPKIFNIDYEKKNVAKKREVEKAILNDLDSFRSQIEERNFLDIELYNYVKDNLFKKEKNKYLNPQHQTSIKFDKKTSKLFKLNYNFFKIYRKAYYFQIIKLIRIINGLPIHGSY